MIHEFIRGHRRFPVESYTELHEVPQDPVVRRDVSSDLQGLP